MTKTVTSRSTMFRGVHHPRRRLRRAESCLTFIAFVAGVAASMGAVSTDKDMVYYFNWANAEGERANLKISLYSGFKVFCTNVEAFGNSLKVCEKWDTYDEDDTCDTGAPPPPAPPPNCVDHTLTTTSPNGSVVSDCVYYRQCCPGGQGSGPHVTYPGSSVTCTSNSQWALLSCPITCQAGCGRTAYPGSYHDVLCDNMALESINTLLWGVGIGAMVVKFLIERCIEPLAERRKPKAICDTLLSLLSASFLAAVLFIYATRCYPGEAFEDIFLSSSSLSQAEFELIDSVVSPSFGLGFHLGCIAAAAIFGALCLSFVLMFLSVRHGERESDVYV